MGREVKRVPLDFDWPMDKVWDGFLSPDKFDEDPCPECRYDERTSGSGSTSAAKWLESVLYLVGMMAEDVHTQKYEGTRQQFTTFGDDRSRLHPYLAELRKINVRERRRPSADIVDLVTGITGEKGRVSFGVASDFAYKAMDVLKDAAGLPKDWGTCPACEGYGSVEAYPGQRAEAEAWERTDPPVGEGWQLWETVSEGSPISPVFHSPEGLAGWMSSPVYNRGISKPMRYEDALAFVNVGWAPSMVVGPSGLVPGEQWVAENQ